MTFARRRNRLTTHFWDRIPVVKRRMAVLSPLICCNHCSLWKALVALRHLELFWRLLGRRLGKVLESVIMEWAWCSACTMLIAERGAESGNSRLTALIGWNFQCLCTDEGLVQLGVILKAMSFYSVAYRGGWGLGGFNAPETSKALQKRAKINLTLKIVKNCWF